MDPVVLCRFPFLKETGEFVRRYSPPPDVLMHSPDYADVRQDGFLAVMEALGKDRRRRREIVDEADALREILTYIVARILVSRVGDRGLIRRFALNEAARMREALSGEGDEVLSAIAGELDVTFTPVREWTEDLYAVHFTRYLALSADRIGGPSGEWKLVNRPVRSGDVLLDRDGFVRLMMEAMVRRISADLPLDVDADLLSSMTGHLKRIQEAVARTRTAEVGGPPDLDCSPPCMRHLLGETAVGANLPHHARFSLVTYLHAIGMSEEDILRLFATAPDFDDRIARYQIDHITGTTSGTEYSVPKCSTLRTYGVCRDRDLLCSQVIHPVQYYRTRRRRNDMNLALRIHHAIAGERVPGPRPTANAGTLRAMGPDAVGRWFEGEVRVRDIRGRRVQVGGRWYSVAIVRLSGDIRTLPVVDWSLALDLERSVGRTTRVRGFVTGAAEAPYLHLVAVLDRDGKAG